MKTTYQIRDREAGNFIEEFSDYDSAHEAMIAYEEEDKIEGNYEKDFYEIVEVESN